MPGLAARLSRAVIGCHPRRWRQRYADEVLAVLDQHHPRARTVLNLAASAASTHLDPAYRIEGPDMTRLRVPALISAAFLVLVALPFGIFMHAQDEKDGHWHIGINGSVNAMAFAPGQHILLTGTSGPQDGTDTLWNVASPARPRRLAVFEGGAPATLSPDGAIVATITFGGQPVLWNVARPRHPARIADLRTADTSLLWGEAFAPDGRVLATAYTDRIYLWAVDSDARPRLLRILSAPVTPPAPAACGSPCHSPVPFYQGDIAFSPDGRLLAAVAGRDAVAVWNVTDPARATRIAVLAGSPAFIKALAFAPRSDELADISARGTVALFRLRAAARPVRVATMHTLPAARLVVDFCGPGGCPDGAFALAFAPDGRTLTAIVNTATVPSPSPQAPPPAARDVVFTWSIAGPRPVTLVTTFSHPAPVPPGGGNGGQPVLAPDGRTVVDGAPFGSFGVTLWALPSRP